MPEHAEGCDWATFDLCTCGSQAREDEVRSAENLAQFLAEREALRARYAAQGRAHRNRRHGRRFLFFLVLGLLTPFVPWITAVIFALWVVAKSLLWAVEAHMMYGNPRLRGGWGYLRFLFLGYP